MSNKCLVMKGMALHSLWLFPFLQRNIKIRSQDLKTTGDSIMGDNKSIIISHPYLLFSDNITHKYLESPVWAKSNSGN